MAVSLSATKACDASEIIYLDHSLAKWQRSADCRPPCHAVLAHDDLVFPPSVSARDHPARCLALCALHAHLSRRRRSARGARSGCLLGTGRRWVLKFGPLFARELRHSRLQPDAVDASCFNEGGVWPSGRECRAEEAAGNKKSGMGDSPTESPQPGAPPAANRVRPSIACVSRTGGRAQNTSRP
jgi:hypothetical protein